MGSFVEINDTLQLTKEQGFPPELDLERHLVTPIKLSAVEGRIFEFKNKPAIRNYQQPPVRVFLAQNNNDRWVYWGKVVILEITHDYSAKTTAGKYKITAINTPDQMRQAFDILDTRPELNYFA